MTELEQLAFGLADASPTLVTAMVRADLDPDVDEELPTLWAGDVGRVLSLALPVLPADEATLVFALLEDALVRGEQRTRDVVATGVLEGLASAVSGRRLDAALLARHLGPESQRYLDEWDDFTMGHRTLPS